MSRARLRDLPAALLILLGAGPVFGQDPAAAIAAALVRDDAVAAARVLGDALTAVDGEGSARASLLTSVWEPFRAAGASLALLGALDRAVAARPEDPVLRAWRGDLALALKQTTRARADFEVLARLDPTQEPRLALVAGFEFAHEEAARRSARFPAAHEFHRYHARLAATLRSAAVRQWGALLAGLALASVATAAAARLLLGRRPPLR